MIFDKNSLLSDAQAITASTASTNVLSNADGLGQADDAALLIAVVEDFASNTDLTVTLEDSSDGVTYEPVLMTAAVPVTSLKVGYRFKLNRVPVGIRSFVRLSYTVGGLDATAGKITAALTPVLDSPFTQDQMVGGKVIG